jgi:hypothetical protein
MMTASAWKRLLLFLLTWSTAGLAAANDPTKPPAPPAEARQREAAEVIEALRESWPNHPEWVDMLTAILQDEPMGPNFGWFRTAKTQTRFDWGSTRKRFDRDGDGRIERREYSGDDADFARLDRSCDGVLTSLDFDFSASLPAESLGSLLFAQLERNGNGKITPDELDALFRAWDRDGQGFLSLADVEEMFAPPPTAPPGSGGPSKATLVRGLFRQELGSLESGPKLGDLAPDFTLKTHDRQGVVRLSEHRGVKPVVLIFGSFT